jgi:hypothetical protein
MKKNSKYSFVSLPAVLCEVTWASKPLDLKEIFPVSIRPEGISNLIPANDGVLYPNEQYRNANCQIFL